MIEFEEEDVNKILGYLGNRPWVEVDSLIKIIFSSAEKSKLKEVNYNDPKQ